MAAHDQPRTGAQAANLVGPGSMFGLENVILDLLDGAMK
jgi:hypothetical protein